MGPVGTQDVPTLPSTLPHCTVLFVVALSPGLDVTAPSDSDVGLSSDGSKVVWDQKALKAKPTAFTFSPKSPQLSVS